jgi:hypothetical protein
MSLVAPATSSGVLAGFAFGAFACFTVEFANRHARAFAHAHFCGRLGDAGAGAGQEYHFAFESAHCVCPPVAARPLLRVVRATTEFNEYHHNPQYY